MTHESEAAPRRHYVLLPRTVVREGRYSITTIQDADIESIRVWRNAQIDVLRQAAPITESEQINYFATRIWPTLEDRTPANLLVAFHEDDQLIGYGGLVHISWEHRRAEISFLLDPAHIAEPARYAELFGAYLGLIRTMAFTDLGLHRIFTETYAIRENHISVIEASGYEFEGRMRDHVRIDGQFVDSLIHGSINHEE